MAEGMCEQREESKSEAIEDLDKLALLEEQLFVLDRHVQVVNERICSDSFQSTCDQVTPQRGEHHCTSCTGVVGKHIALTNTSDTGAGRNVDLNEGQQDLVRA